jgi:nicotinamidase-related amidase
MPEGRQDTGAPLADATAERRSTVALLLVDVINDLAFPGADRLIRSAETMSRRLERLADRARAAGVPVIYVNDNFGRWRSDWRQVIERCLAEGSPGRRMVGRLQPHPEDYFVLKPRHSGFYSTTLDLLLHDLGTRTVIVTGVATDICVLFTANDAYMRGYHVIVPRDGVAASTPQKNAAALRQIREVLKADTPASASLRFGPASRAAARTVRPKRRRS